MRRFLQRLGRKISSGKIPIIMCHGVFDFDADKQNEWNPTGKHLYVSQLDDTLKKLCKNYRGISLNELVNNLGNKNDWPNEPCFALTFDDGYAGFEKNVLPLLEKYNCPASFFPVINFVDGEMLWMDQVEAVIRGSDNFVCPDGQLLSPEKAHKKWRKQLKQINASDRLELFDKYFHLSDNHEVAEHHKAVNWEELRRLHAHDLVSIGNHTLSHPILANENKENMTHEIMTAAERLRHELGDCDLFCYPYGGSDDHNEVSHQVVKETGHRCALLTSEALTSHNSNAFLLPRFSLSANTYDSPWFWNGIYGLRDLKKKFLG